MAADRGERDTEQISRLTEELADIDMQRIVPLDTGHAIDLRSDAPIDPGPLGGWKTPGDREREAAFLDGYLSAEQRASLRHLPGPNNVRNE